MDNISKIALTGHITGPDGFDSIKANNMGSENITSFKDLMTGMVRDLDSTVKAPDQLLQSAVTGNGADVHDVMIAISKAEIGINLATQVTTKVVQAYEKVMSIQV